MKRSMTLRSVAGIVSAVCMPLSVFAAPFGEIVNSMAGKLNSFIPPLLGIGVLIVVFGIVRYINAGGDAKKLSEGRTFVLWGIIGLFVMVSFWGFVSLLLKTVFGTASPSDTVNIDALFNF